MKSLPFTQKPAEPKHAFQEVGNEHVGILQIPCVGWITADEADLIGEVDPTNAVYVATCQAAVKIAELDGIGAVEAQQALTRIESKALGLRVLLTPEEETIRVVHHAIIAPLLKLVVDSAKAVNVRRCTVMIRRLRDCDDWSDADSNKLPGVLRDGIAAVCLSEEAAMSGGDADAEAQIRQLEEDLGKLPPALSKHRDPTGAKRTGSLGLSIPPTRTRRGNGLAASRSRTSSKRLTAAYDTSDNSSTGRS